MLGVMPDPSETDPWLVVIDAQTIFADPRSPWGSPMWADTQPALLAVLEAHEARHPGRMVFTRFVADPGLGGSWAAYYEEWPFALKPADDPAYAVVPDLAVAAAGAHEVVAPTFGKWTTDLRAVVGEQPHLLLAGVATDCCVLSTALPAADAGATVEVLAAACAGSSPQAHEEALASMARYAPQITVSR